MDKRNGAVGAHPGNHKTMENKMCAAGRPSFGSFSEVAQAYPKRPPYSRRVLKILVEHVKTLTDSPIFADIGAGTGATAYALADMGLSGYAIEPDSEMVATGKRIGAARPSVSWINAPGECTGLADGSLDWVCYSTSFHWTNTSDALRECMRILRSRAFFTITCFLTDLETDPFQIEIESRIRDLAPALRRARPPIVGEMSTYETLLNQYPGLGNCIALTSTEAVPMTEEQYINYWKSSHDIPSQVSPEVWNSILQMIAETFRSRRPASLRFRSAAWHAQRG
ncbi:class I SAM-dependent methyltransferase [Bradyrhizobium glycinis]|uniref:class I SAM-dependent methyltransferase n=1 Tax=Bradyrhizobium glycinis TaxID=2751812 RepID=UPI0018DA07C2|nr:class I SAM-dependent methyltransferase [Bradyrhizobium glycinis]MBH5370963.1 class I SAM-dependent methyltransferase [Bradyrhizobium glycinis]